MVLRRSSVALVFAGVLAAQQPELGAFETRFDQTHPRGSFAEITTRMRWRKGYMKKHDPKLGYAIAEESFFVHVPKNYKADGAFGLLVWISPGPRGNCAADWPKILEKHKLIHIGAHNAGNDRFVWYRIALALDAVCNMQERYRLDQDRIYIAGHSGGGRTATTIAMLWSDVFDGGIYANGTNHFRKIPKPGQQFFWPAKFPKPIGKRLELARWTNRHVFVNGEKDFNVVHSRLVYEDLRRRQGFKRTTLLLMKGKAHDYPDARWLSQCFDALDRPLFAERKKAASKPKDTQE